MREVARLGFVLLGLHLVFSSIQSGVVFLSQIEAQGGSIAIPLYAIGAIAILIFLPGCLLAVRSTDIAIFLFPDEETPPDQVDLVAAGVAVLGVYMFLHGLAGALSYGALATTTGDFPALTLTNLRSVAWSVLEALLGLAFFRYPRALVLRLGRGRAA